jgi:hypothetical protein
MQQQVFTSLTVQELEQLFRSIVEDVINKKAQKEDDEKLISPAAAIKLFEPSISKTTLASWTQAGYLEKQRIGGKVYYHKKDVLSAAKTIKRYKNRTS